MSDRMGGGDEISLAIIQQKHGNSVTGLFHFKSLDHRNNMLRTLNPDAVGSCFYCFFYFTPSADPWPRLENLHSLAATQRCELSHSHPK